MRTLFFITIIVCFAVSCQKEQSTPQKFEYPAVIPQSLNISVDRLDIIDLLIQEHIDKGLLPHALTFVAKNGVVIHNKAFGWNNIENDIMLKKDDIFRNFSQTKAITSVALMTLFEKGKFHLNEPVSKFIPECTNQVLENVNPDGTYTTRPVASPLTIRHLLCHTSGILGNSQLRTLRQEQMKKRDNKPYETLAEEVIEAIQLPLAFDPGTQWNYHPSSDVCGYLVEVFSGMSLRDYVKQTILEPLGMIDTDWFYPENYRERIVTAYIEKEGNLVARNDVWSGRNPFQEDQRYCQGGTGLSGTIEDYARFCQMILNGGIFNNQRILGRKTIEMMSVNQLPEQNNGGKNFQFGLGFEIYPYTGISNLNLIASPGSLQWGGMYNTDYLIDPKERLIILLYTNRVPDIHIWEKFLNTVYQALM